MGISRDRIHKRRSTGAKVPKLRIKRRYDMGRAPSMTKLAPKRVRKSRVRGGRIKLRASRLDRGTFAWTTEGVCFRSKILDVVYNASNNDLVRMKVLVKGCIVAIDATPFRQWYEKHYGCPIGIKRTRKSTTGNTGKKGSAQEQPAPETPAVVDEEMAKRQVFAPVEQHLQEAFGIGRLLVKLTTRPGQSGRADGYILEGRELDFYLKKSTKKK